MTTATPLVLFRSATQADASLLLAWRNDPITRLHARNHAAVPQSDHIEWLTTVLSSPATRLWIAECGGQAVGQARLDFHGPTAELAYTVAPSFRGRGLGTALLRTLRDQPQLRSGCHLVAHVSSSNAASRRALRSAGWEELPSSGDFIEFRLTVEPAPEAGRQSDNAADACGRGGETGDIVR